uniref:Uncharacterized protein n=1 Tax=Anopheles atroparvus TaxID=41427 RepID=A0AAG5CWI5_ANOAO
MAGATLKQQFLPAGSGRLEVDECPNILRPPVASDEAVGSLERCLLGSVEQEHDRVAWFSWFPRENPYQFQHHRAASTIIARPGAAGYGIEVAVQQKRMPIVVLADNFHDQVLHSPVHAGTDSYVSAGYNLLIVKHLLGGIA